MEPEFWRDRWQQRRIAFHLDQINPRLLESWPSVEPPAGATVLVPLCGKSVDMAWLAEQGLRVVGIELSELAAAAFFEERQWSAEVMRRGPFAQYRYGDVTILQGDFFDVTAELVGPVALVYDRAALIALPPSMRQRYVDHLAGLCQADSEVLLVTMEYDQREMNGPPFAVLEDEVAALYARDFVCLGRQPTGDLEISARFREKGLGRLNECRYRLRRR